MSMDMALLSCAPGGMSIDVALSTRRDVGRDTYSLPKKKRLRHKWHVNG